MFQKTRLKLTLWYVLIVMIICGLFSAAIYANVNREFRRFEHIPPRLKFFHNPDGSMGIVKELDVPYRLDPEVIEEARLRFLTQLGIINFAIIVFSGALGYFLAGRTLNPIRQMIAEQKRFVSDSSHELRTPLTSLRSEIEVNLRNKKLTVKDARKILESNLEEVINLQTLSDRLLDLAQNGKINQSFEIIDLSNLIDDAVKKTQKEADKKHIVIAKKLAYSRIQGVPDRLTELFVILFDNAIKYSPKHTTISVVSKITDDKIRVSVTDQGVGIDERDLLFIFDRFYRASKSRSKDHVAGYGLGLSIAQKIVKAHDGSITVQSTVGKGTTFKITFPKV